MKTLYLLILALTLASGCSATSAGKAETKQHGYTLTAPGGVKVEYQDDLRTTEQPAGAGILQSPKVQGSEAGELGGISFTTVGLGSIGGFFIKAAIALLLIISGAMHARRGEFVKGIWQIVGGVVLLLIPTAWLVFAAVGAALLLAYSLYAHTHADAPGAKLIEGAILKYAPGLSVPPPNGV